MQTCYYASSLWKEQPGNAVAISRGIPKWYKGKIYLPLAPSWALIQLDSERDYIQGYYRTVLAKLDPVQVYRELGENAILLCYEKPPGFCHRRLAAKWLEDTLGIIVPEMKPEEPPEQIGLF